MSAGYIGRLAPSPTGALHLGNVRTFMVAWLRARSLGGRVILRIADLLKRTVNLIQCHADDRRCLALGGSHLADLQQNLHQEPGTDSYGNQRKRNEDFFFGRQHFLHGTKTNPPPDGGH